MTPPAIAPVLTCEPISVWLASAEEDVANGGSDVEVDILTGDNVDESSVVESAMG